MDAEGYPEEKELAKIRNWDCTDFPNLLDFVEELHIYKDYIKREIGKDYHGNPILIWSFSTGGWSGNEDLINALLKNTLFSMWHYSWRTGGHYVFKINPRLVGFQLVKDYCRENNVSRQWVSKAKDKFQYFKLSPNKIFVRPL